MEPILLVAARLEYLVCVVRLWARCVAFADVPCRTSCLAQVCLASVAPSDRASFGHRSGHRSETPSPLSFTRPKAAGEGRSMSCPTLGHRSGWGPHRFSCPPHPFGVSGPFLILINLLALNSDGGSIKYQNVQATENIIKFQLL